MTANAPEQIRRLRNGSIDLAFYAARGHELRSREAHRSLRRMACRLARLLSSLVAIGRARQAPATDIIAPRSA